MPFTKIFLSMIYDVNDSILEELKGLDLRKLQIFLNLSVQMNLKAIGSL